MSDKGENCRGIRNVVRINVQLLLDLQEDHHCVNVWFPVRNLVYIYICHQKGGRLTGFRFLAKALAYSSLASNVN